jgi:uncharacterized protein YcfJ
MRPLYASLLSIALAIPSIAVAGSTTSVDSVVGTVGYVETLKSTYVQETQVPQRVCRVENVPIYAQSGKQSDELGSMIVGGLIGSAVGNGLTSKDGAGTVGAVAGALIGRDIASKNNAANQQIVGYQEKNVCENITTIREDLIETVTGYRIEVMVDGRSITLDSNRSYRAGDQIYLNRKTTYSLR